MRSPSVSVLAVVTLAVAASFWCLGRSSSPPSAAHHATRTAHAEGRELLGRLPVAFVPNLGQWEHAASHVARFGAMTVFLEPTGWTLTLTERTAAKVSGMASEGESAPTRGVAVRMRFAGAAASKPVAEDQLPGRHNYFLGSDPSRWRSDVPLYGAVRYREVHPGVDVRAREHDGRFEYDLLLQPGADLEPIEVVVEGAERLHLDGAGALVMETRLGPVRMPAPLSWEEGPSGERSLVACSYVLRGEGRFGFEVPGRQTGWALVVDPGLVWSTFLGGTGGDDPRALAVDVHGTVTVAGRTWSASFPTTPGAFDTTYNGDPIDSFVTRLSSTGSTLVYSTFLGGRAGDYATGLTVDVQGVVTVAGSTASSNFPTTLGSFDTSYNGGSSIFGDAFVTRLSATGASLVYSTFLGGTSLDSLAAIAVDAQGAATVVGETWSTDFPTTSGAFDRILDGSTDTFVTRLSPQGSSLVYSTFLGGASRETASAVAVDAQGEAVVGGNTDSIDFPTTPGALDTSYNGATDAFVSRLTPQGSSLVYSTFLGGAAWDAAQGVTIDPMGEAGVAGQTDSSDFPTTPGAFDTSHNGGGKDAFVTRLSPTGSRLVYSTFLGGAGLDWATAVAVDAQGAMAVVGTTQSLDFPTTPGALAINHNGMRDTFVTRLSPRGSSLRYSTFLGGTSDDSVAAVGIDSLGAVVVTGETGSVDFPTTPGAFDTTFNSSPDTFITRLDMLPTGVSAFGRSSPGCIGPLAISVTSMPNVGNAGFALTCGNAPPNTSGLLALTGNRFANPVVVLGAEIWVDPTLVFIQLPATTNNVGASEVPLPIPNGRWLRGTRLFAQFFWAGPASPPPCPPQGLSASNALEFTIQP